VLIHEGLLLANSHSELAKDEHFLKSVANPFDFERRSHFLNSLKFEKVYKSGYAPIEMQEKNKDELEDPNINKVCKTHFIRKKQSTLSLPRSCGVSYIKASESTQGAPFEPLPPLIFQCSSMCSDSKESYEGISTLLNNVCQNCWLPFIQSTEERMRDLLLGRRVGEVKWVKGMQNLWPLFNEGSFFLFPCFGLGCLKEEEVWKAFGECPFKIGILAKKSTSGKKALLKSLNIKEAPSEEALREEQTLEGQENTAESASISNCETMLQEEHKPSSLEEDIANKLKNCKKVITLSLRLEMYVQEQQWKNLSQETRGLLNYIIINLKGAMERNSLDIIRKRLTLSESDQKEGMTEDIAKSIREPLNKSTAMQEENLQQSNTKVDEESLRAMLETKLQNEEAYEAEVLKVTESIKCDSILGGKGKSLEKSLKMPLYYISTRDSFAFDLVERVSFLQRQNGRTYKKIEYFFEAENLPTNYSK
jgi:hypothetical protein